MSLIILEGCDKTGKTTLTNYLHEKTGYPIIKCSQPKKHPYEEYMEMMFEHTNAIFDRFIYGNFVYGKIYKNQPIITDKQMENLEMMMQARDAQIIYCHADTEFIKTKFITDNETFTEAKHIERIKTLFEEAINKTIIPNRYRKIPTDKLDEFVPELKDIHGAIQESRYIGELDPDILFIGERNNPNANKQFPSVSVPFDFGRSSTILKSLIKEINIISFGFTNTYKNHLSDNRQDPVLIEEINYLKPKVIVALGNEVSRKLDDLLIKHEKMWHPSYLGRFKKAQRQDFIDRLNQIKEKTNEQIN